MKSSLVEAAGRGDGGIVVHPLAAVHGPVVVAVVVHVAVSVKNQTILTRLLGQGAVDTLVEFIAVGIVRVGLHTVRFRTARVLLGAHGPNHQHRCQTQAEHPSH